MLGEERRKLDVPAPERGYWNKLQAGQKVDRTQLPARDLGTINRVEISGRLGPEAIACCGEIERMKRAPLFFNNSGH